jgi:hypothetical protein
MGLTPKCFSEIVANALLKVVEEPPENVTFIFLTENIENIISTIVSRSQAFYVLGNSKQEYDYDCLVEPLSKYPAIEGEKALVISEFLMKLSKERGETLYFVLSKVQSFMLNLLKNNSQNKILKSRIMSDFEKIQNLLNMLTVGIKEQIVADEAGYILTR